MAALNADDVLVELPVLFRKLLAVRGFQDAEEASSFLNPRLAELSDPFVLPGMAAAKTALPVLGVPVESKVLRGVDSLLSIVQMPVGVPVGTFAIGKAGAANAALFAVAVLASKRADLRERLQEFRAKQTADVLSAGDPRVS